MKYLPFLLFLTTFASCQVPKYLGDALPVSHAIWDSLLTEHVTNDGRVDYEGFIRDSMELNKYLEILYSHHPNDRYWTEEEQLAYWINAYNAFTVKLIVDHYPVESIKDIKSGIPFVNSVWDIRFISIETRTYDLNQIEHGIIRKWFNEPRIHFAINCASISCPNLRQHAYTAGNLNDLLTQAAKEFISDPSKNKISATHIRISPIFKWFNGDFTKNGSLIEFLNQYSPVRIQDNASIEYMDYNWGLNGVK